MKLYSSTKSLSCFITSLLLSVIFSHSVLSKTIDNQVNNKPLRIAVASNFTPALKKLLIDFHQHTNISTQIISGATGAMFIQIQHGAPFDIFFAADSIRPKELERQGLIATDSRHTYAKGQLAFLSINSEETLTDFKKSSQESQPRFAIANPDTAPYGKAARETLEYLGLWQQYKPKLIIGMNINQTFAQIRTQAVSRGLVANSQLVLNDLPGIIIPSNYHQPIEQQLVILKNSTNIDKAQHLIDYLLSPAIQQKIVSFGYAEVEQH
jgi:molybdate transport system substrate-binding protein